MASPAPASSAKICISCNADVANAPRMKDPQGRYYCQACASKQPQQAAPRKVASAPAAVAAASDDVMSKIIADATAKTANLCPSCQHPVQAGAKICTGCGLNFELGKKAQTRVVRPVQEKSVKSAAVSDNVVVQFIAYSDWGLAACAALPLIATAPLVMLGKDFFGLYALVLLVVAVGCLILTTIDAFKMSFMHGLGVLVSFFVLSGIYMLVYAFFITESPRLRWLNVTFLVAALVAAGIVVTNPELQAEFTSTK